MLARSLPRNRPSSRPYWRGTRPEIVSANGSRPAGGPTDHLTTCPYRQLESLARQYQVHSLVILEHLSRIRFGRGRVVGDRRSCRDLRAFTLTPRAYMRESACLREPSMLVLEPNVGVRGLSASHAKRPK